MLKYLNAGELENLSDEELDGYATKMVAKQMEILDKIDDWTDCYNLIADEYTKRAAGKPVHIKNDSTTRH